MDWMILTLEFITLLVVIDPVGTIPVYLYAVQGVPQRLHRRFAVRAVLIATLVLLAFLAGGQLLLEGLGLRLGSFQIAGGIVLFLFAMSMIFGETKAAEIAGSSGCNDGERSGRRPARAGRLHRRAAIEPEPCAHAVCPGSPLDHPRITPRLRPSARPPS